MQMEKHFGLLGMKVVDQVTGRKGVVVSVSFDLFGCIQAVVQPEVCPDGTDAESAWYDVARLKVTSKNPVMDVPNYEYGYVAEGLKGPADKPAGRW